jgi:hypothetical protein
MLASCPASILNHFSTRLGIPFRFGFKSSRSSVVLAVDECTECPFSWPVDTDRQGGLRA